MSAPLLQPIANELIDFRFKGFAPRSYGRSFDEFTSARPGLFDGCFVPPVMVLKLDAIEHNIETMASYCRQHDVLLAPHGKTTLAPRLFERQLRHGAWGITVATVSQVTLCRAFGVRRVLLANELVDPVGIDWILDELEADTEFEFLCYVDSADGVELLAEKLRSRSPSRSLNTLVELGHQGGRSGCRSVNQALAVGRAAASVPNLRVVGLAGYEGTIDQAPDGSGRERVRHFLNLMRAAAEALHVNGLLATAEGDIILSAGGSVFFDEVVAALQPPLVDGTGVRCVIRPGAYIAHDDGAYSRTSPFSREHADSSYSLRPALEVWGQILSLPEPGLALANVGQRDAPWDEGPPVPLRLHRLRDGRWLDAADMEVTHLNDQHSYVSVPRDADVRVGDWLAMGISHPCTAFDRWRLLPVVDSGYRVVDLVRTYA
jgi:D-serine deaminase-like pyridoxal phosphate-dependent protein